MKSLLFAAALLVATPAIANDPGGYGAPAAQCERLDAFLARAAKHIRAAEDGDITTRKAANLMIRDRNELGTGEDGAIVREGGLDIADRQAAFADAGLDYDVTYRANMRSYCLSPRQPN